MKAHEFMHEMRTTSAVFGRKHDISVVFKGDEAATDGKTIFLPSLPPSKDLTPEQVRSMRGYVDHEAGHIRHSDMPRILDFYDRCMNNNKEDLKNLHNCLEDIWMEGKVMDEYYGSASNFKVLNDLIMGKSVKQLEKIKSETGSTPLDKTNVESACFAVTSVGREDYGGENVHKAIDFINEDLKEHTANWTKLARECESTEDVITLAKSVYKLLKEEDPELSSSPEDFDPTSGEGDDEGENSEEFKNKGDKAKEGNPCASGKPDKGDGKGKGEGKLEPQSAEEALTAEEGDGASGAIGRCSGDQNGEYTVCSTDYDVDYRRGKAHPSGSSSKLREIVNSTKVTEYDNTKSRIRGEIMVMKTKFRRALLAKKQRDWDPGRELGRLDSKRLVAAVTGSRTVFKQRIDREEEDTAVTILVDLSGSMYGGKANAARDCVIALSECLEGSDIKFNVVGFCNRKGIPGRRGNEAFRVETLDTVFFKDFDSPLRVSRGSINAIPDAVGGNNSDYDFIVNAINDLKKRPEDRKVLLVLSDGYPAHAGCGSEQAILRHCKNAVTVDAKKAGVECVGIGIQSDAVQRIYPNNVVIDDVNELATAMFAKLTKLLIDGSKSR